MFEVKKDSLLPLGLSQHRNYKEGEKDFLVFVSVNTGINSYLKGQLWLFSLIGTCLGYSFYSTRIL